MSDMNDLGLTTEKEKREKEKKLQDGGGGGGKDRRIEGGIKEMRGGIEEER